ncbi:hypothetical protein R3W88_027049 [Solanum pinnatisectum]|uniref:Uncharacterized protein n=1 Tax=Solanum pinnatisectum TaxID=50273 RepID=A0AAV9LEX0_9SOLN|nr:hypothetical protein R3W88_027049 [Solanum pinnatisectum]
MIQKTTGMLEVDDMTVLTARIAAMQNIISTHFNNLALGQQLAQKQKEDECFGKFLSLLKQVHINLLLVDVLQGIPRYGKYVKEIVVNKMRLTEYKTVALTKECSSRIQNKLPTKLKDPGSFTVQNTIWQSIHVRGLCDLGASINLMPTSLYKKLRLGSPKPPTIILQLVDRSVAKHEGVVEDVLVQVESLIFLVDFVMLNFKLDPEVPFILGRPFLATRRAMIDVEARQLTMCIIRWRFSMCIKL